MTVLGAHLAEPSGLTLAPSGRDEILASNPRGALDLERAPLRDASYIARLLGLPPKTVLQYAREGRLPSVRIGRHVRFIVADVEQAVLEMSSR